MELERQNFEAKSAVVVKETEVQRLREELEAATQVTAETRVVWVFVGKCPALRSRCAGMVGFRGRWTAVAGRAPHGPTEALDEWMGEEGLLWCDGLQHVVFPGRR